MNLAQQEAIRKLVEIRFGPFTSEGRSYDPRSRTTVELEPHDLERTGSERAFGYYGLLELGCLLGALPLRYARAFRQSATELLERHLEAAGDRALPLAFRFLHRLRAEAPGDEGLQRDDSDWYLRYLDLWEETIRHEDVFVLLGLAEQQSEALLRRMTASELFEAFATPRHALSLRQRALVGLRRLLDHACGLHELLEEARSEPRAMGGIWMGNRELAWRLRPATIGTLQQVLDALHALLASRGESASAERVVLWRDRLETLAGRSELAQLAGEASRALSRESYRDLQGLELLCGDDGSLELLAQDLAIDARIAELIRQQPARRLVLKRCRLVRNALDGLARAGLVAVHVEDSGLNAPLAQVLAKWNALIELKIVDPDVQREDLLPLKESRSLRRVSIRAQHVGEDITDAFEGSRIQVAVARELAEFIVPQARPLDVVAEQQPPGQADVRAETGE